MYNCEPVYSNNLQNYFTRIHHTHSHTHPYTHSHTHLGKKTFDTYFANLEFRFNLSILVWLEGMICKGKSLIFIKCNSLPIQKRGYSMTTSYFEFILYF